MTSEAMEDVSDFYILGLPIETSIGTMYPIKVKDYVKFAKYTQILNIEDFELKKMLNPESEMYKPLNSVHFFYIIKAFQDESIPKDNMFYEMCLHYQNLFKLCFQDDVFNKIKTSEEFEYYRELIRDFNGIKYDKPNPNPEIERYNKLKKLLEAKKGDSITFEAMYTSVLVTIGNNPNDLTLYQFYEVFNRIGHFKNYDTTTLYKTVDASGSLDVQPWYGETKEETERTYTEDQYNEKVKESGKDGLQTLL